ncbi:proton extrusion protein PcxA [Oscillatoriales cyanobacterium USR001]|nr:proton extrusion protein PcxA [Oscillatoriales cyanobacterium USR001]
MTVSPWMKIDKYLHSAYQWYQETPERALNEAYNAALAIQAIERKHFNGKKISAEFGNYGESTLSYFNLELKKYLKIIRMRKVEFNFSYSVFDLPDQFAGHSSPQSLADRFPNANFLDRLEFIDEVTSKYTKPQMSSRLTAIVPTTSLQNGSLNSAGKQPTIGANNSVDSSQKNILNRIDTSSDDLNLLPRSLLKTINRIGRELDPESEKEIIKNFRNSKVKTIVAIRFILLYLILIPLLTQQVSKNFIVGPIVDHNMPQQIARTDIKRIFINPDLEREAFEELQRFEEKLNFEQLIGLIPQLSIESKKEKVQFKAIEIAKEYRNESANAVKNVFSDLVACGVFAGIIFTNRRQIDILKSFMDELIYGLSDSAKAFIIILFTDMFVGFHSPHGWEVLLGNLSKHLGVAESRDFNYLFIATFPVILDAVFKYWIFRYLNRSSPSAVATYKNMNE